MNKEKIRYVQKRVKETMSEFDYIPHEHNNDQQVETMITHYLLNEYENIITPLVTPLVPEEGINLLRVWKDDARKVVKAFEDVWRQLGIDELPTHVTVEQKIMQYNMNLMQHTIQHKTIRKELLNLLKNQSIQNILHQLEQLLCLTYWLILYYTEKQRLNHVDTYNKHLHHFLSDLVVTFLLLLSELFPREESLFADHDISGIMETAHGIIGNFPKNPIFLELVLEEIYKILYQRENNVNVDIAGSPIQRVPVLESSVYDHFANLNISRNVCKIISDQARYMVSEKKTRRNFVVRKTINSVVQAIKSQKKAGNVVTVDNHELYVDCAIVMTHPRNMTLNVAPLFTKDHKEINKFHHQTYVGIVWCILEDVDLPDINQQYWFAKNTTQHNFQTFLGRGRDVVRQTIQWFTDHQHVNTVASNTAIAQISICLREIIVSRCYLAEKYYKGGIIPNGEHTKVLIHFIAFRTLMMLLLPTNSYRYGEQQVAKQLPQYAWNVNIPL